MLGHIVNRSKHLNWMDEVDRGISELHPMPRKSCMIGDPLGLSECVWQLDDEKSVYPFQEMRLNPA